MDESALPQLCGYLQQSLDPNPEVRRQAEAFFESMMFQPGWAGLLMLATTHEKVDPTHRFQSAIMFKELIRKVWADETGKAPFTKDDGSLGINEQDRVQVKTQIVDVMVRAPPQIQKTISEAIRIIGVCDFPGQWPQLLPYMIEQFKLQDFNVINGVLQTAETLFDRYRSEFECDSVNLELRHILDTTFTALMELFTGLVELTKTTTDIPTLKSLFHSLVLLTRIFYDLNYVTIPEEFEDNMAIWFGGFHHLLGLPLIPALASDDDDRPGVMEELKTEIVQAVSHYTMVYDEEFKPYVQSFVTITWGLLTETGQQKKFDNLLSLSMKFLAYVAKSPTYKDLFADPATLQALCEKVVAPNVMLRAEDEEVFEMDADEYIRIDIEGSDVDTRRRGATDLVRGLCTHYEEQVIGIFGGYIQQLLAQYAASPAENWKAKDAATFLILAIAVKGEVQGKGATATSNLINVMDYFASSILPDLQEPNMEACPVLKADAIKFVMTFRNIITKEQHAVILPLIANHLTAPSEVVCSYSAACVERCLLMKMPGHPAPAPPLYAPAEVGAMAEVLFTNLFQAMARPENAENEYIMKAILRTLSAGKEAVGPTAKVVTAALSGKMLEVAKNVGKARFYHFLFEAMSCAIKYGVASNPVSFFEASLFPSFEVMLTGEVLEFQPYVFQLMAQMLEAHVPGSGSIDGGYQALFPMLLHPQLWESAANSSPMVRLIQAYIVVGGEGYITSSLEGILGIFHKLISTKAYDHEGFNIVATLVEVVKVETIAMFMPHIFQLCFTRLAKAKTLKFMRSMLHFVGVLVGRYGGSFVIGQVDGVQAGAWNMLMNRLLTDVDAITDDVERKTVCIGLTKLLTETPEMHTQYAALWPLMIQCLVRFIELDSDGGEDEENQLAELEKKGYQAAFVKLAFGGKKEHDPFKEIGNAQGYLATQLSGLEAQQPGSIAQRIPAAEMAFIQKYMQAAGLM